MSGIASIVKRLVSAAGFDLRRRHGPFVPRATMDQSLGLAKSLGLKPATIVDVGVNTGTPDLYGVFADVRYVLIDPLAENEVFMRHHCRELGNAAYVVCAAGASTGEVTMSVSPAFGGSSMFQTVGASRQVPLRRLDDVVPEQGGKPPYLLKLDTQGAELEILKGAPELLRETEMVILEVQMFPNSGMPSFGDLMAAMTGAGFTLFDVFSLQYRPRDGVLGAMDAAFVRKDSPLAQHRSFRTPEQIRVNVEKKLALRRAALREIGAPEQ